MKKFKQKYQYEEIARFIELTYAVLKYQVHPKFPPIGMSLIQKDQVVIHYNENKDDKRGFIVGFAEGGWVTYNPNRFLEFDEFQFFDAGRHLSNKEMKGAIINTVAHELSHIGQKLHTLENVLDLSGKKTLIMEKSNELFTLKWIRDNSNYITKYLGSFDISEMSRYLDPLNNVPTVDFEYVNSWNEIMFDEMDALFMYSTSKVIETAIKNGFTRFRIEYDLYEYIDLDIEKVLNSEDTAKCILRFLNYYIFRPKIFFTSIFVVPELPKTLLFVFKEDGLRPPSSGRDCYIIPYFNYDKRNEFIKDFSYEKRFNEYLSNK